MDKQMKMLAELSKEMRGQECYKKYQECLQIIKEDEALYEKLNHYRRRNVEIHLNHKNLREEARLEREFHSFLLKEQIREFLHWEHKTMEMIRKVHEEIDRGLDLDIGFF